MWVHVFHVSHRNIFYLAVLYFMAAIEAVVANLQIRWIISTFFYGITMSCELLESCTSNILLQIISACVAAFWQSRQLSAVEAMMS